jgi:UTP--glucose-1-phosphate uridylyltransferase
MQAPHKERNVARVRKAVITAAGRGTRHQPASLAVQKEMFPLVDRDGFTKPMIQIIIEEAIESGIEEICIVTAPHLEPVYRNYFCRFDPSPNPPKEHSKRLVEIGRRLHFVRQTSPEGLGHAVYQSRSFVADEPFLLLLGDHIHISQTGKRCARQLIEVFESHSLDAATAVQIEPESNLHLFGTIKGEPIGIAQGAYRALGIVEKPSIEVARERLVTPGLPPGNFLAHFGMHVFSPRIFDSLEHLIQSGQRQYGEFQLAAAQEHLRQHCEDYWALIVRGIRCDAGIPQGLIHTQIALAMHGIYASEIRQAIER